MYVKKLKLVNMRSFGNTEIELSRGINLLVGNNNSGKSTIVKSLYKLQSLNTLGVDDVRKTQPVGYIYVDLEEVSKRDAHLFAINHKGLLVPDAKSIKVCFGHHTSVFETQNGIDNVYFDSSLNYKENASGRIELLPVDDNPQSFTDFYGLPNTETQNNFIYPFFAKRKTNYYSHQQLGTREAFHVGEDLRNITSKIQSLSNPSHVKHKDFVKLMDEILGFTVGVIPYKETESNTGLFVNNNTVIPIESMGEGVVNIVGLLVLLLTEDNRLYLIEELENDIHPMALKKLLALILEKSSNNQFVISTHSNIIVKYLGIGTAKIFQISWKPYEHKPSDWLPTSEISLVENDPQSKLALLESLGYDLFDFDLFKSYIILEESSAEKIIRDFLIPEFCPSLVDRVKTHAASGATDLEPRLQNFLSLFVFIHQNPIYFSKAWVFADGDPEGKKVITSIRSKFPKWPNDRFVNFSKKYFEEFYPFTFEKKFKKIMEIADRRKRQDAKIDLTKEVVSWIESDKVRAKRAFAKSAKEVIDLLKKIEGVIK